MNGTSHHFIPSMRQGLATKIDNGSTGHRARLDVILTATAAVKGTGTAEDSEIQQTIELYGPGDVLGFDERIVVRPDPKPDTGDFESNYFPAVEFADADFAWRFAADPAGDKGKLTPWITLLVLVSEAKGDTIKKEFEEGERNTASLPRCIKVDPSILPDLSEAWRWAHVHIAAEESMDKAKLEELLRREPERATCRLLCARRLAPGVRYAAFVVPTFKLGALAGLGCQLDSSIKATDLAWEKKKDGKTRIPYYYRWEFGTGMLGDFEHLVRLLEPRKLTEIGLREMDCVKPGFGTSGVDRTELDVEDRKRHVLDMEGALQSLDTKYTPWGHDLSSDIKDTAEIKNIEPRLLESSKVRIRWRTSEPAKFRLEYGESDAYGTFIEDKYHEPKREHICVLEGLDPGKTYHFKITTTTAGTSHETPDNVIQIPLPSQFENELAELLNQPCTKDLSEDKQPFKFNVDSTQEIKNIHLSASAMGDSVTVTWDTDEQRTSRIDFDYTNLNRPRYEEDNQLRQNHSLTLNRLIPGREYNFKISGVNATGDVTETSPGEFSMPPLPVVVPPVYGRWHLGRLKEDGRMVDPADSRGWIDTLNLDPRHRAAAGLGAEVIRRQQEPLMAAAWEQLGAIEKANDILRRAQLGRDSSTSIHKRLDLVRSLQPDAFIRITGASQRIMTFDGDDNVEKMTVAHYMSRKTLIPSSAVDPAFRRIAAPRRAIGKRQQLHAKHGHAIPRSGLVQRLVQGELEAVGPVGRPLGTPRILEITRRLLEGINPTLGPSIDRSIGLSQRESGLGFDDELINSADLSTIMNDQKPFDKLTGLGRAGKGAGPLIIDTMANWLDKKDETSKPAAQGEDFISKLCSQVHDKLAPNRTFLGRTKMRMRHVGVIQKRFAEGAEGDPLDPILWAPEFDYPMYEPLRDLGHSILLPGVEKIPQNTIGILESNKRFLESYLCGCNHEFAGELLWRCYPTDQRGSYFRQFWDVSGYVRRVGEEESLLNRWLDENAYGSIEDIPSGVKQYLLAKNLDATLERLIRKWLEDGKAIRIEDLSEQERQRAQDLINAIEEEGADALALLSKDEIECAVEYVVKEECFAERLKDIKQLTRWRDSALGENGQSANDGLVLVIRGNLLQRYPNALIYAIEADMYGKPCLGEYVGEENEKERIFPLFRATLPTDLTFFGFPFDKEQACGSGGNKGMFFVIEEQPGEPRFGLDDPSLEGQIICRDYDNISWSHFGFGTDADKLNYGVYLDSPPGPVNIDGDLSPNWGGASSAQRAWITWQKPVRIAIHAKKMLP